MRLLLLTTLAICVRAQNDASPTFEAAFVKLNTTGASDSHSDTGTANVRFTNLSLRAIIARAYELREYQVQGPEWLAGTTYDIVAKAAFGTPDRELPAMLRTLLAERFRLETHRESKNMPVYALVPVKNGFLLKPVEAGSSNRTTDHTAMGGQLSATKTSLERLALWLSRFTDRPVVDATGIEGVFDFTLKYSVERENAPGETREKAEAAAPARYPIVPLAIQEQLGLKLEKRTAPVEVLSVDRVERVPTEN